MKQKINVIVISVLAISLLIVSFVFAINYRKESISYFRDSGYIINNSYESDSNKVNKLYFETETSYTSTKDDTYTFTNSEGVKVSVSDESFVHYSSGSIMSLKKGVAIDLNDIDAKLISYYNVFEGSVLTKKNEVYEIDNLGQSIAFSKLMFKISNNKYLIASKKIIASFSDNQTVDFKNYIEIEYVSENVIRIYNDEVNYQTIASNLYLIIDDIKIDLEYKTISKNNVEYLTMADMVINSDDNIEILPEKEVITPEEEDTGAENNNVNNGGFGNNTNQGGTPGNNTETDIEQGFDNLINSLPGENEQIDEEDEIIQPKFKVNSMEINTLGFENLELSFEDESAVLYGNRTVEILENSTGKVVQKFDDWEEGEQNYVINSYFSLKPNTAYTLNVVGQYKIEDTVYDRTFISKIFRTLDMGINIIEDYVTTDSLSFAVYRNSYSQVNGFSYNVKNKGGEIIIEDTAVMYGASDNLVITEEGKFNPNTEYVLTVKDIVYGDDLFSSELYQAINLTHSAKTLKENPFKISDIALDADINNQKGTITFSVEGLNDIYGGVVNYTYNIYNEQNDLQYSITNDQSNSLTLNISDLNADSVYFNVVINFDDNEKTIMYTSHNSDLFSITGIVYPKVVEFISAENNMNYETLIGKIVIDDKENFIESNNISTYKIDIKEKSDSLLGGTQQFVDTISVEYIKENNQIELPVSFENLDPQKEYVLYVYLEYNDKNLYLGYSVASTGEIEPLNLTLEDKENSVSNSLFDFSVYLTKEKDNYSTNHLNYLKFNLYGCYGDQTCTMLDYSATLPENQDAATLYNILIEGGSLDVYSNDFEFYIEDYILEYDFYKVSVSGFSYGYEIPIYVNGGPTNEYVIEFNDIPPELTVKAHEILNSECTDDFCDRSLESDTTVGFKFEIISRPNPMGDYNQVFYYDIYRSTDNTIWERVTKETSSVSLGTNVTTYFSISDDTLPRGYYYYVEYYGDYGLVDGTVQTKLKSDSFYAEKQKADISGYVSGYNYDSNSNLTLKFKLNINDPDVSLQEYNKGNDTNSVVLVNTTTQEEIYPTVSGNEYVFPVNNLYNYKLKVEEKILDTQKEIELYEVKIEEILDISDSILIETDGSISGKIIINVISENLDLLNRFSGLKIYGNAASDTKYYEFIRKENKLSVELNLREIKDKLGKIHENTFTFNTIDLIYDSGAMVDPVKDSMFIKWYDDQGLLTYYDFENNYFSTDIKFNHDYFTKLKELLAVKSLKNNSAIGNYLKSDNLSRTILINEAKIISKNGVVCENINEVLSTDKVNTVYTAKGAKVSFDIIGGIPENTTFNVELMGGSENSTTKVDKSGNTITVTFNEISDSSKNYTYSISYSTDGVTNYVYDGEIQNSIINREITSLKILPLNSFSSNYSAEYWHWTGENNNNLTFEKQIVNNFDVDTSKYILNNNEEIKYSIVATNTLSGEETVLVENVSLASITQESAISTNSYIEILDNSKLKGEYKIELRSYIDMPTGDDIGLESISLNESIQINVDEPEVNVENNGSPNFTVSINDKDGLLEACTNCELSYVEGEPIRYVNDATEKYFTSLSDRKNAKVVYFKLNLLTSEGQEVFKGYLPIPFVQKTLTLDLTEYFANKPLPTGIYRIRLHYSVGGELKEIVRDFTIYNASLLNVQIVEMPDSYILMLNNPEEELKDSIDKIVYQYTTSDNKTITQQLTKTELKNDLKYTTVTNSDATTTYFLGLSTKGTLTSTIRDLTVQFYDGEKLIYTYSK